MVCLQIETAVLIGSKLLRENLLKGDIFPAKTTPGAHLQLFPHHGLVVVLEVDPPSQTLDGLLPLFGVPGHDAPAVLVVRLDTHLHHLAPAQSEGGQPTKRLQHPSLMTYEAPRTPYSTTPDDILTPVRC